MEILKILQKKSGKFYFFMILFGISNGLWNFGLLSIINATISDTALPIIGTGYRWQLFLILAFISLIFNKQFQNFMIRLTNDLSYDIGLSVINKLRFASYSDYEDLGKEKVYTALEDAQQISTVPRTFIESFQSLITVLCCFLYLLWVSPIGAGVLIMVTLLIIAFFIYRNKKIEADFNQVRDLQNNYFTYVNDLLLGFREIKMGTVRNDNLYNKFIDKNRSKTRDLVTKNQIKYVNNNLVGSYSLYLIIGMILFILPVLYDIEQAQLSTFIVTVLYAMGSIAMLINLLPVYTRVKIAVERLNKFEEILQSILTGKIKHGIPIREAEEQFESLRLEEVTYQYYDDYGRPGFKLGPISLEIKNGEILFIRGGNGSGKSTLMNLLTGLYVPTGGNIYLNDTKIDNENTPWYRDRISAIFTDSYLFNENYDGFDLTLLDSDYKEYLQIMHLADHIKVNTDRDRIEKRLSKGQSKRLAMLYLQMEQRDICILDEWAAEQDPEFKEYFYQKLIGYFKDKGKTMILITHDDQYFSCAERIIKLNNGQIQFQKILAEESN
ncbi:MAG: cyclic peptide export ABC transporter [Cyclobacteriaceae bacterium]